MTTPDFRQDSYAQRCFTASVTTPTANGTVVTYWCGMTLETGLILADISVVDDVALAASGTNYLSFQPVVSIPDRSAYTVERRGTGISTATLSLPARAPVRLHTDRSLDVNLPPGALVGVEVTCVSGGALAAQRLSFMARMRHS